MAGRRGGKPICAVKGCKKPRQFRDWCALHYDRWKRTGNTGPVGLKIQKYPPGTLCRLKRCSNKVLARGLCGKHYARWRQTRGTDAEISDLRYQRITGGPCTEKDCNEPVMAKGLCRLHYQRMRNRRDRARFPERYLGYHLNRYGITVEEYRKLEKRQRGVCAICKNPASYARARDTRLHVDHCHKTGRVRGLLCYNCNVGIAKFSDDPQLLRSAARYVGRT